MHRRIPARALLTPLLAIALTVLVPSARADDSAEDAAERAFARDGLLRRAGESVDPTRREAGNLPELKKSIDARRAEYGETAKNELAEADRLLGVGGTDGLIQEAAILYRWILGSVEDPPILLYVNPANAEQRCDYEEELAPQDLPEDLPEGVTPLDVLLEWSLRVERQPDGAVNAAGVDQLRRTVADDPLLALTDPWELAFWICRPWVVAREQQVAARKQAYEADAPAKGLVSERTVRVKEARAVRLRTQVETYQTLRERSLRALDRLVLEEERLKEDAGRLGFDIEEARRASTEPPPADAAAEPADEDAKDEDAKDEGAEDEAPKDEAPKDEGPKAEDEDAAPGPDPAAARAEALQRLGGLQLKEIVGEQKLRLLYLAVRRAELRLELYDKAIRQAKEEALAAEAAHKLYADELSRMRREQQMVQLGYEEKRLRKRHLEVQAQVKEEGLADVALWTAYEEALQGLMAVNGATREAVRLRRALEASSRVESTAEIPPPPNPDCAPPPEASAPADTLRRFRDPRADLLSANYARDAVEVLDDPGWGANLTAEQYEAVDDRIAGLESALEGAGDTRRLQRRLEEARGQAEEALGRLEQGAEGSTQRSFWISRARFDRTQILEKTATAFKETLRGIREERERVSKDLGVLRDYRSRLLGLGARSFKIRVNRTLDSERLGAAYDDASDTVSDASRWITFEGDEHAGTFVGRHWPALLGGLAAIVVSILLVRFGRRGLDRVLRSMAARVPALRSEPVTVRAEQAQAKRVEKVREAAAKLAEQEALREVSKEEAARPQRMGEGGYSGGEDA